MIEQAVMDKLFECFPKSFINSRGEFIGHKDSNTYFVLRNCETEMDIKCKVLEWFTRSAFKTRAYYGDKQNENFHKRMLNGINKFLGTSFSKEEIAIVYTYLGNSVKHGNTIAFINGGYNMDFFKRFEDAEDE